MARKINKSNNSLVTIENSNLLGGYFTSQLSTRCNRCVWQELFLIKLALHLTLIEISRCPVAVEFSIQLVVITVHLKSF